MILELEALRSWFRARLAPGPNGCVDWTGSLTGGRGYAQAQIGGRHVRASRLGYELFVGPIPEGAHLLHACDRPRCVSIFCLSPGSRSANMRDMVQKGRANTPRGSASGRARLAASDRALARAMRGTMSNVAIAAYFGVAESTIRRMSEAE